jgi:hypothetical protein
MTGSRRDIAGNGPDNANAMRSPLPCLMNRRAGRTHRGHLDWRSVRSYHREVALTDESLEAILAAEGWPFERLDATTWRSGFQAPGPRRIRFFLRLTSDWLFLTIIPFAVLPDDRDAEHALMRRLLELNRRITLAKFAVERRDIVLTVELPTQELTQSQIRDGLDARSVYASRHYPAVTEFTSPAS